ncbi:MULTISPECIES: IS66 family insertion sequence element accessory protein TnpB [unclassified Photobacterium]|uniref:IS66 family insertion sequence element accessory protein TnpA n=1 Tax=unclassified Photobacterium TaxID=2628852 RepID=UPI001EDDFA04|nr:MULTISPECIES: IS66 family insertion sequence element accessory protein TnpB [unclassified Photobacterium]MCG3865134.1 IS66 family insertion sequence element accessory protein TnpB [Photobacterium sp. Ph6]MCG3876542.1 IS66 family insertion sequence element accessory protein TnpB [Photobacterium sp. Ph5]
MTQFEKHQYWTAIVNQQQDSGISIPQFCKQNDINYANFHYWMKKIEQTDNEQIAHQVVISEPPILNGEIVVIHLPNGIRAELPASLTLIQIQTWLKGLQ